MLTIFKRRFWQPPRAHGDLIEDRTVSFLELFYDLVYVVVIARAAHHLAEHLTWRGVGEFAVVFGMIWLAWLNGSIYQDLHGREDGRSRTFIFVQMAILALLGVYTADAAGDGGRGFAIVYTALFVVLTWLWFSVRRQDAAEYMELTARYLAGMLISVVVIGASALLPADSRVLVWAVFMVGWVVGALALELTRADDLAMSVTESTIERFGLFTIIVLGEVVVGVVTGLSEVERNLRTTATGVIGLMIGFGIWWTYFDFVGRRAPKTARASMVWIVSHLPVTLAIAASGAALVSFIEHAGDQRAPANAAWVLTGSVAVALVGLIVTMRTLADYDRLISIYRPLTATMGVGAAAIVLVGWWRPAPWLLVLAVVAVLSIVWSVAVDRWLRLPNPSDARPGGHQEPAEPGRS
jgi:low temperature requirement protein LtrA